VDDKGQNEELRGRTMDCNTGKRVKLKGVRIRIGK
jgi:hypothetical protein